MKLKLYLKIQIINFLVLEVQVVMTLWKFDRLSFLTTLVWNSIRFKYQ